MFKRFLNACYAMEGNFASQFLWHSQYFVWQYQYLTIGTLKIRIPTGRRTENCLFLVILFILLLVSLKHSLSRYWSWAGWLCEMTDDKLTHTLTLSRYWSWADWLCEATNDKLTHTLTLLLSNYS